MKRKGSPADIETLIKEYSNKYGVDPLLALAVAKVESNLNPKAISPKGAVGVMQLMPSTARELGVENLYAPSENIEGGIKYLRFLSDKYQGDIDKIHETAKDPKDLEKKLLEFKGVGPTAVNIFLRELRGVWSKAKPKPSPLALKVAEKIGLENVEKYESQLVRIYIEYCKKKKCQACPVKQYCT